MIPKLTEKTFNERRKQPLCACVESSLERYFADLEGHETNELYQMVIDEVELPLLKIVMKHTRGNQSKAAELLGINRTTLRKKLERFGLNE